MRVELADAQDMTWLQRRTSAALTPDARGLKVVEANGTIRGMVVFDIWTHTCATMHVALATPIAGRHLLRTAFECAFVQGDKRLLLASVPAHNRQSLTLARRLGFENVHRIRDGFALGDDLVLLEMRREDCRWLSPSYGLHAFHGVA